MPAMPWFLSRERIVAHLQHIVDQLNNERIIINTQKMKGAYHSNHEEKFALHVDLFPEGAYILCNVHLELIDEAYEHIRHILVFPQFLQGNGQLSHIQLVDEPQPLHPERSTTRFRLRVHGRYRITFSIKD